MNGRLVAGFDKAVEAGLWLTAFLLPVVFYLKTYDTALVKDITLQALGCFILAAAALRHIETGRFEIPANRVGLAMLGGLLLAWICASYAFGSYPEASLMGAARLALFAALFVVVLIGPASIAFAATLADWTLASAAAAGLYALAQAAGSDPLMWKGAFGENAFSTMMRPHLLGVFLGCVFPLGLARAADPESSGLRRTGARAAAFLCALGVLASGSPLGLAVLLFSGAAFALGSLTTHREAALRADGLGGAVVGAISAAVGLFYGGAALQTEALKTWAYRRTIWASAWELLKDHLLAGAGAGAFSAAYPAYRLAEKSGTELYLASSAHSEPLQIACELGLTGLVLWGALFASVLALAWMDIRRRAREGQLREPSLMLGLWAGVLALLAAGCISDALRHPAPGALLWLSAGALAGLALEKGSARVRVVPVPAPLPLRRALYLPLLAALASSLFWAALFFNSDVAFNRGVYHAKNRRFDVALEYFARVSRWHTAGLMARYHAGNILMDREGPEDPKAALARYREVERMSPHYARLDYRIGHAQRRLGDWKSAEARFKESIRRDPAFAPAYYRLAEVSTILKKDKQALAAALELVRIEPNTERHWRFLAEQYRSRGRYRTARRMLERAQRVHDIAAATNGANGNSL